MSAATISAWVAHALAWATGIWFVFGPAYAGESVTATRPGEPRGESTRVTMNLIEANGLDVVFWLLVPLVLTGIALLAVHRPGSSQPGRKALLWITAVALLGYCAVLIFSSIGVFYLPAALALLVAAITYRARPDPVRSI